MQKQRQVFNHPQKQEKLILNTQKAINRLKKTRIKPIKNIKIETRLSPATIPHLLI